MKLLLLSLALLGASRCGYRSLAEARVAADVALDHPETLICEPRQGGFACTDAAGSVVWCPPSHADPCLPLDEAEELPW